MKLLIREFIGPDCLTVDDGQVVYNEIYPELLANRSVILDFANVGAFASPFFNYAIGQLLKDITSEQLNRLLSIENINPIGKDTLSQVIKNAKERYANPDIYGSIGNALEQILNGEKEIR